MAPKNKLLHSSVGLDSNMITADNRSGTDDHPAVITRKTKQNRKRNAKQNAKKREDNKDTEDTEDDKLAAIMKILSESKTNANDQVTEQDETAQKDSEESQAGILQSIKKLLSKQSPSDDSQTVQDSSVDKKDGEDSEKATLQAIAKILGQKNTNEKSNKKDKQPVPGGNMTEDGQLPNGTKGKNTSTEPKGKGTTMASQSKDSDESKESERTDFDVDDVCGPCHSCEKNSTKILARIAELETKRKALLAEYGDTTAADRLDDVDMMQRIKKRGKTRSKPKGGFSKDDEEEEPVMKRLVQLEDHVKLVDQVIEESKMELEAGELECKARRIDTYIHGEQVKFLHIHGATPEWVVPGKYKEHAEVMGIMRDEAGMYWMEAAGIRGKSTKAHEGPCPCGQPVSGYLLYAFMALIVFSLVASIIDG